MQFAAAQAAGQAAWIAALATPAAGQTDSAYVLYRAGQTQAAHGSELQLAAARARLDIANANASAAYGLAAAAAERDRTIALAQVQDGTAQTSLANPDGSDQSALQNQDALSLAVAQADRQQALDYLAADATYDNSLDSINRHPASDSSYDVATALKQSQYARDTALATADYNWRTSAAAGELRLPRRKPSTIRPPPPGKRPPSRRTVWPSRRPSAMKTWCWPAAKTQNMLDQTAADNVQQAGDATANAGFQTAQYAATVTAMTALGAGLTSGPSNTPVPWAQFEVQQAIAQQAAWNSTLDVSYLAWQQQASAAYSAYAASQAQAYAASAADIAARNYANAVYAAGRTQQEAVAVAGAEYTFDMSLAGLVSQYRQNRAQADYAWADASASDTLNNTSNSSDYQTLLGVTDPHTGSAANAYQTGYVQLDGTAATTWPRPA